jgi:hypothetical protein
MDRYQIAESPNGPWLELQVTNNPVHALAYARASFADWRVVWIARMRPIRGSDLLPTPEVMFGEMEEMISDRYGSAMADLLHDALNAEAYRHIETALTGHLLDEEVDVLVPAIKKSYIKDQAVRPTDFIKEDSKRRPSLEELLK